MARLGGGLVGRCFFAQVFCECAPLIDRWGSPFFFFPTHTTSCRRPRLATAPRQTAARYDSAATRATAHRAGATARVQKTVATMPRRRPRRSVRPPAAAYHCFAVACACTRSAGTGICGLHVPRGVPRPLRRATVERRSARKKRWPLPRRAARAAGGGGRVLFAARQCGAAQHEWRPCGPARSSAVLRCVGRPTRPLVDRGPVWV